MIIHSVTLISQDLTFFIIQFYYNVLQLSNFTWLTDSAPTETMNVSWLLCNVSWLLCTVSWLLHNVSVDWTEVGPREVPGERGERPGAVRDVDDRLPHLVPPHLPQHASPEQERWVVSPGCVETAEQNISSRLLLASFLNSSWFDIKYATEILIIFHKRSEDSHSKNSAGLGFISLIASWLWFQHPDQMKTVGRALSVLEDVGVVATSSFVAAADVDTWPALLHSLLYHNYPSAPHFAFLDRFVLIKPPAHIVKM